MDALLAAAKKESEAFHAALSHQKYLLNLRGIPTLPWPSCFSERVRIF
jgi:hypothetical protein